LAKDKFIVYQLIVRLFGNGISGPVPNGDRHSNGCGKFGDINNKVLESLKDFGATHVWYTGVIEHATLSDYSNLGMPPDHPLVVKGVAGSPYAIRDFYDIDPDLASDPSNRMQEFELLLKRTQEAGLQTIIDFVPNHVARFYLSDCLPDGEVNLGESDDSTVHFSPNNNYYYFPGQPFRTPEGFNPAYNHSTEPFVENPARATGNDCFSPHPGVNDWFETVKLNYGVDYLGGQSKHFNPVPNTWHKMHAVLSYWATKGIDGFRCDMVELVPVEFWAWVIPKLKQQFPALIFIGEVYNPGLYKPYLEAGFDYLYDKVGHYDAVRELIEKKGNANHVHNVHEAQQGFQHRMLKFIENHDEQRLASKFVCGNSERGVLAHAACLLMHKGPAMVYFGQELGEAAEGSTGFSGDDGKTTIFDYWIVPTVQTWIQSLEGKNLPTQMAELRSRYQKLNHIALQRKAIVEGHYYSIQWANAGRSFDYNEHKTLTFLRYTRMERLLIILNFEPEFQHKSSIKIPYDAWKVMNLPAVGLYTLRPLFGYEEPIEFYAENVTELHHVHAGIKIPLQPWTPMVFELLSSAKSV
jgi:glycosidase